MPKKTVTLSNMEGHQFDPEYGTMWSDTYVEFHLRRKKVYLGPTLLSISDLDRDRELHGEDEWYEEPQIPEGDWEFCLPYPDEPDKGIPHIAINGPWVTKPLIERAVEWYLRRTYGLTAEFRFRWKKNNTGLILTPW